MTDTNKAWTIWATRPQTQNKAWVETLQSQGFNTIDIPLLSITPVSSQETTQRVKSLILELDQFQKVIFVSQNAVIEAFKWIDQYWPQLPQGLQFFAIGEKTAECLRDLWDEDVTAASTAMNSEELLRFADLSKVKDQKILVCRGVGGLPKLGEELQLRGASLSYCELYHRSLPQSAIKSAQHLLNELSLKDIIMVFSGETLQNFVAVLETYSYKHKDMPLVVPGERVAHLAETLGFTQIIESKNASTPAMVEALNAWLLVRF